MQTVRIYSVDTTLEDIPEGIDQEHQYHQIFDNGTRSDADLVTQGSVSPKFDGGQVSLQTYHASDVASTHKFEYSACCGQNQLQTQTTYLSENVTTNHVNT
jgi:hypothetical protein